MRRNMQTLAVRSVTPPRRTPSQRSVRPAWCLAWLLAVLITVSSARLIFSQAPPPIPEQNSLVDVVVHDRVPQRLLSKAAEALKERKYDEAIELLQRCFSGAEDNFVLLTEWPLPGARANAAKLLRDAGEPAWKLYEIKYGIQARLALETAEKNGLPAAYELVIRQFEHTVAGGTALDRLASWFFDRGEFDSAVDCWQQLLSNPVHMGRVNDMQRMKLLVAAQRCQRQDLVQQVSESLGQKRLNLGGKSATAAQWLASLKQPIGEPASKGDWRLLGGSTGRHRVTTGSAPFLRPTVAISMFDSGDRMISPDDRFAQTEGRTRLQREIDNALASGVATGYAGTPVVNGNLILWRDVFGISAIDRVTRKLVWSESTASTLHSLLNLNSDQDIRPVAQTYSRNSVLEQLTTDGQHVYFVDQNTILDRGQMQLLFEPNVRNDGNPVQPPWNSLVALRLSASDNKNRVAWKLGGEPGVDANGPLSGHYFLGPPLPVGGLLYSLAEHRKLFYLMALQPESGQVVWKQTLSFVPQASRESAVPTDRRRLSPAVFLSASQGILVCPLGSGVIVGVRQLTGEIAWIQDYRSRGRRGRFPYGGLSHNSNEQADEAEFPNPPLIHQGRVYFLGPGDNNATDRVYCFDLQTGKKHWDADTTTDLKYLATVNDELLLGVGGSEVVGILVDKGSTKWSRRVPRISGVGVAVLGLYLLPVAEGRVLSLDPRDGTEVGFSMQVPGIRPGNLVVSGKDVISLNGLDLQIFPQSAELLASLEARPSPQRQSYAYWYELGELQFRIGQIKQAKINLQKAVDLAPGSEAKLAVRNVLRELAWQELNQQPDNRESVLAEYAELCDTPEQQAQHLLLVGEEQVRTGKLGDAHQTARSLLSLNVDQPLKLLADPDRQLSASIWVADLTSRTGAGFSRADQLQADEKLFEELLRRDDERGLVQLLQQQPHAPWSPRLRLALANMFLQDGRAQAAELLVWNDHLQNNPAGLDASRFLLELWEAAGLYEESGHLLQRFGTELAAIKGTNGQTGLQLYGNFPRTSLAWPAVRRFVPIDWKVDNVRIDETHELKENLGTTFNVTSRYLYFPQSSQQLVTRGHTLTNMLQQVDMETGSTIATITLPPTTTTGFFPSFDTRSRVGHFLPIGGDSACYGISLLERGLAWNLNSTPQFRLNNLVRIGPSSPHLCVLRSRDRLFAVDPATGNLLWERDDLEEGNRVIPNALTAIPGDSEVIVLLESDSKGYRLYKTSDGTFIRAGQLKDCFYIHHQFGRNLLYSVMAENNKLQMRSIKLWDPLTDKVLVEANDMATIVGISEREPEFTVAAKSGLVRVIDGLTGNVKIEAKLNPFDFEPPQQNPPIKAFTDGTRYYINLNRQAQLVNQTTYSGDALFPTQAIAGDLHAIDPQTSQVLWTRTKVSPQNVVHLADYRLPFLVTLSRWRDRLRGTSQTLLKVDVIDGQTGQVIANKSNGYNDRMLLLDYDRDLGRIRMRGEKTQLQLNFGKDVNRPGLQDDEFVDREIPR